MWKPYFSYTGIKYLFLLFARINFYEFCFRSKENLFEEIRRSTSESALKELDIKNPDQTEDGIGVSC